MKNQGTLINSRKKKKERKNSYSEQLKAKFEGRIVKSENIMFFEYYSAPFAYYMTILADKLSEPSGYRKEFWLQICNGTYLPQRGIELLNDYQGFIEQKMKAIIEKYSIGYWLHLSRRVAPASMGKDRRNDTVVYCFNILNAAIQKYAKKLQGNELIIASEGNIDKILNGIYLTHPFNDFLPLIKQIRGQFVLGDFDHENLWEFFTIGMLAYEMWFSGAKKRIVSKGADLIVSHQTEDIIDDNRNSELDALVLNFDNRKRGMHSTATGTVFQDKNRNIGTTIMTQVHGRFNAKDLRDPMAEFLELELGDDFLPNFTFVPFDILAFTKAHLPLSEAFRIKNNVGLEYVIGIIADVCLCYLSKLLMGKNKITYLNMIKRSYQLYKKNEYTSVIENNWPQVMEQTGIEVPYDKYEVEKAIAFLTLSEENASEIHIATAGPLKLIIPWDHHGSIVIDHSVTIYLLYNLFHGIPMNGHNFRGDTLEDALKGRKNYLPTTPCKGMDKTSKQIDFSIVVGDVLVIAECKVVAHSFGILGGDARAIAHRTRSVVEKGLAEVDAKAEWLISHPKGTNYNLKNIKFILSLVVSPFTEYIHSYEPRYWLTKDLPRVLNIDEFEELISSGLRDVLKEKMLSTSISYSE